MPHASKRRWFRFAFSLRTLFVVVTIVAGASACSDRKLPMEFVGEQKAIELAKKELVRENLKVDDYRVTVTTSSSGEDWLVIFDPTVQRKPGGGYWATVDKVTGKVIFKAGD